MFFVVLLVCVCVWVCVCVCVCERECVRACVRACVCNQIIIRTQTKEEISPSFAQKTQGNCKQTRQLQEPELKLRSQKKIASLYLGESCSEWGWKREHAMMGLSLWAASSKLACFISSVDINVFSNCWFHLLLTANSDAARDTGRLLSRFWRNLFVVKRTFMCELIRWFP